MSTYHKTKCPVICSQLQYNCSKTAIQHTRAKHEPLHRLPLPLPRPLPLARPRPRPRLAPVNEIYLFNQSILGYLINQLHACLSDADSCSAGQVIHCHSMELVHSVHKNLPLDHILSMTNLAQNLTPC